MKRIIISLILIAGISCKKEVKCESWKYYDECIPKNSTVYCVGGGTIDYRTAKFCNDQLNGIYPGATKTIHDDASAKIVRHFVNKV